MTDDWFCCRALSDREVRGEAAEDGVDVVAIVVFGMAAGLEKELPTLVAGELALRPLLMMELYLWTKSFNSCTFLGRLESGRAAISMWSCFTTLWVPA